MARLSRLCVVGAPHHVIQRGNNRQACCARTQDFAAYAAWLNEYARKHGVAVHSWVFMTNHVHLLVTPSSSDGLSQMMQCLGRRYVRYFNETHQRTGTLWEGRFRSCVVDDERYLLTCQRYIELNPVRAGMVNSPNDYAWSSFQAHAFGRPIEMWQPHPIYLKLAANQEDRLIAYRALFASPIHDNEICSIRDTTNKGMVLGSEGYRRYIEELTGRRVSPLKPGPRVER